ncbi:MAG: hypothetical protein AAGN66_10535 [Acidobacteriota bacterium]
MSLRSVSTALFAVSLALALPASGAIQSTNPDVVQVAPPATVLPGANTSNTQIQAFDERQCITLDRLLPVDAINDGTIPQPPVNFPIAAGTRVSCHFLHFDPNGSVGLGGDITFDSDIVGVIVADPTLDASDDVCGLPGTAYPTGTPVRGAEQPGDVVSIDLATRTVRVNWFASDPGDQMRVITECTEPGIPEIEAKLDQLEPQLLDNQAALEAKLDALQGQVEEIQSTLRGLREAIALIEAKLDALK